MLEWWVNGMTWIIENIILTYQGKLKGKQLTDFWFHIFKYYYGGGSGINPSIDGWICNFFPYIDGKKSAMASRSAEEVKGQIEEADEKIE